MTADETQHNYIRHMLTVGGAHLVHSPVEVPGHNDANPALQQPHVDADIISEKPLQNTITMEQLQQQHEAHLVLNKAGGEQGAVPIIMGGRPEMQEDASMQNKIGGDAVGTCALDGQPESGAQPVQIIDRDVDEMKSEQCIKPPHEQEQQQQQQCQAAGGVRDQVGSALPCGSTGNPGNEHATCPGASTAGLHAGSTTVQAAAAATASYKDRQVVVLVDENVTRQQLQDLATLWGVCPLSVDWVKDSVSCGVCSCN